MLSSPLMAKPQRRLGIIHNNGAVTLQFQLGGYTLEEEVEFFNVLQVSNAITLEMFRLHPV